MDMRPARDDGPRGEAHERRLVALVDGYVRSIRGGGTLDPEPYLRASGDLRSELEPLLAVVLKLELWALRRDAASQRRSD